MWRRACVFDGTTYLATGRYKLVSGPKKDEVVTERVYEYAMHGVKLSVGPGEKESQFQKLTAWIETLASELEQEAILYTVDKYDGRGAQATFVTHPRLTKDEIVAVDAQNPTTRKLQDMQVCVCVL